MSAATPPPQAPAPTAAAQAVSRAAQLLRSRSYIVLLVFGALIGVPVAVVAYFYLQGVSEAQKYVFTTLPGELGFDKVPVWWPLPPLALSGLLVALTIRYLPGTAGHEPAEGFKAGGAVRPIDLPGIFIASFATLSLGVVLGPEAPLIAIGSGLGVLAVHLLKRDAPAMAIMVIGSAGSFAAISTLLGSPLVGAFLMLEAAGLGGAMLEAVLVPGLLAAGVGSLIFIGLNSWTGYGTFSLAIPNIPPFDTPKISHFLWAFVIGIVAALVGAAIRRMALGLQPIVKRRALVLTPVTGLAIGCLVIIFTQSTSHNASDILFSGQAALPSLIDNADHWTLGALVLLVVCKALAYGASLSCFRGGPVFPGMFIGAALGIAMSHGPGLPMIAGAAMGMGAMTVAMLGMPLFSVLLPTVFLQADGLGLQPLVIVAVVVSYVISARLAPDPGASEPSPGQAAAPAASAAPAPSA